MRLDDRFFPKVRMTSGCWEWTASKSSGYGQLRYKGKKFYAHRIAYEQMVGPIPEGLTIDHLCRNRACVRPDHLEAVTSGENTLRGVGAAAINAKKDVCLRGHPYDAGNTYYYPSGQRECRKCRVVNKRKRKQRVIAELKACRQEAS